MDVFHTLINLTQRNLAAIITILWSIWATGVLLGMVICTVSSCARRRDFVLFTRNKEHAGAPPKEDTFEVEVDPHLLKATLIRRETELREDCERMGLDFDLQTVLENFREKIASKLADLPATILETRDRLQNIHGSLHEFNDLVGPDQASQARRALKRGETGKAAALLQRARFLIKENLAEPEGSQLLAARDKRLAARAVFLLGQLEETNFNYFTATQYYQEAVALQPSNPTYLTAAAALSYAFGELHETEHMLTQLLKIQQKLLGPEHADLAQTLNNFAVLRHTQGRHAEAEAFYLWAIEICEGQNRPHNPEVVNLMQNFAAFLQEIGRPGEANTLKRRAVMA
jgi:tetratricopeptide (TPR) repeat protein